MISISMSLTISRFFENTILKWDLEHADRHPKMYTNWDAHFGQLPAAQGGAPSYHRAICTPKSVMTPFEGMFYRQLAAWLLRPLPTGAAGSPHIGLATDTGLARSENQDRAVTCRGCDRFGNQFVLSMVADGIGGLQSGDQAASVALAIIADSVYQSALSANTKPSAWLDKALKDANALLHHQFRGKSGTTVTAVLLTQAGRSCWASIGDSRLYEYSSNALTQWSTDDTLAGMLGIVREAAAAEQTMLLQHLGIGPELVVEVHEFDKKETRKLLLCSDGAYFVSPDSRLFAQLLETGKELPTAIVARRMVEVSKWAGGPDNSTVILMNLPLELDASRDDERSVLNIWDCFGEMTYFVPCEPRLQPSKPLSSIPKADSIPQEPIAVTPSAQEASELREETQASPKRNKRKAAPKRKRQHSKATSSQDGEGMNEDGEAASQVQLSFS